MDIDAAYDVCEQITRAQARHLYSALEPLPAYRRRALCAIYAFARRVDDTAQGNLPHAEKLRLLADARAGIPRDGTPRPIDPVLVALRDVNRRFPIPLTSLDDLIDGAESDVHAATYDTFEDLVHYCRQVAGSIGRLSVAVLGSRDPAAAAQLADDLGVAMQLTNILRDCVEDFQRGRVYLPREDFELFGCPADPLSAPPEPLARHDPPPGAPKPRVVRPRTRAATAARRPWSGVRRGTGRDPHAPPRAHRPLTDRCPARTDLPARARESPHRGNRAHGQSRPVACRLIGSQQPFGSF